MKRLRASEIPGLFAIAAAVILEWYFSFVFYMKENVFARDGMLSLLLAAGALILALGYRKLSDQKAKRWGSLLGTIFALSLILGRQVSESTLSGIWESRYSLVRFCVVAVGGILLWIQLWVFILHFLHRFRLPQIKIRFMEYIYGKRWLMVWGAMFLCYLPCYISFFPGNMSYDSKKITEQALGLYPFSNFQPFLHTLLWTGFVKLEEFTGIRLLALVAYSICQMLALTAVFTYTLYCMKKWKIGDLPVLISFLFYTFCPTIVLFSFITTKDILFGAFLLLFSLQLISVMKSSETSEHTVAAERRAWGLFVVYGLIVSLLRNNMLYVMVVMIPLVWIGFRRKKAVACISLAVVAVCCMVITGPFYRSIGVLEGFKREMLSVPLSQIADVIRYQPESLSPKELETALQYMPDAGKYVRKLADPIKYTFNEELYEREPAVFWKLWIDLLVREPAWFLDAFLVLNSPSWYIEDDTIVSYIEIGQHSRHYTYEWPDPLPPLRSFYTSLAEYEKAELGIWRLPVVRQFFAVSTPIWVMITIGVCLCMKRRYRALVHLAPALLLWLTYMLGPVSCFRYMFPIMILYPVMAMLLLEKQWIMGEVKENEDD